MSTSGVATQRHGSTCFHIILTPPQKKKKREREKSGRIYWEWDRHHQHKVSRLLDSTQCFLGEGIPVSGGSGEECMLTIVCSAWVRTVSLLRFLVWRGYRTERLGHRGRTMSCRTRVPSTEHVKDLLAVGNRRRVGQVPRYPDTIHRIP